MKPEQICEALKWGTGHDWTMESNGRYRSETLFASFVLRADALRMALAFDVARSALVFDEKANVFDDGAYERFNNHKAAVDALREHLARAGQ